VLFTLETRFGSDAIINVHNQHQWAEEDPHGVIHYRHQQQFSINVWAGIVGDWFTRMFRHIGLQATLPKFSLT
jgi:hypothetical protein